MAESDRRAAAWAAFRGACWWATPVIMLAAPIIFLECVMHARDTAGLVLGTAAAVLFCGGFWGVWVGSAAAVGWLRGA